MKIALTIVQIIVTLVLIVTVLMQSGKAQGLSGSIAGGAETFFGKNKGGTIDGLLSKLTSVFAILFIISSVALSVVM
jgi:preprotein translocase subunit SecG